MQPALQLIQLIHHGWGDAPGAEGASAAHDITDRINAGEENATKNYLKMLRAGGSMYAMDLFTTAGVDMTSKAPIEAAFKELDWNVNKLEEMAG